MFKKLLLGIFLLVTCAICMGVSDWKKCNTELILANTHDFVLIYNIKWLDHDLEDYKGYYIRRCGGEIQPYAMNNTADNSEFRLCPGRHVIIWHKRDKSGVYYQYDFIVTKDMKQIVLTPEKMEILKI